MTITIDPSIEAILNDPSKVPTTTAAVSILRGDPYDITDPTTIATYIASSSNALINPNGPNNTGYASNGKPNPPGSTTAGSSGSGTSSAPSFSTILGMGTSAGAVLGMVGLKSGSPIPADIGTGFLAGAAEYGVYYRGVSAGQNDSGGNIAILGGLYFLAIGAMMLWLSKLAPTQHDATALTIAGQGGFSLGNIVKALMSVIKHGNFTIDPYNPAFWYTLAIAATITSAVLAAGVLAGSDGGDGESSPLASTVSSLANSIPRWYQTLPSAAVVAVSAGLTVSGTAYSLAPTDTIRTFNEPTVNVIAGLSSITNQDGSSMLGKVLIQQGQGTDPDIVTATIPQADGTTTGIIFRVNADGFLLDSQNNPMTDFPPIFQPILDSTGKVVNVKQNFGALGALQEIPACMAIVRDNSLTARTREAAMENCMLANKSAVLSPFPNSSPS